PYFSIFDTKRPQDSLLNHQLSAQLAKAPPSYKDFFLKQVPQKARLHVANATSMNLRNMHRLIDIIANDSQLNQERISKFKIEWHKKFTLSFACMLLFLIGAPLGAIIRKGGLGMPVVIAISFFIIYFIISSTGEKLAK